MMNDNSSNTLAVLLEVKESNGIDLDDDLIKKLYELHKDHQYEKDRSTIDKMRSIIENHLTNSQVL